MSLKNNRVVIVGGTSGIGLEVAKAFRHAEATVVISSRTTNKVEAAKELLGSSVSGYAFDFRDAEQLERFFKNVGEFDHLVVTAGEATMGPFASLPVERAKSSFDSKFWGQYLTVKAALPYLNGYAGFVMDLGWSGRGIQ